MLILTLFAAAHAGTPAPYAPQIDPANFKAGVDNPFFPLVPGTVYRFTEKEEGKVSDNVVTVTSDTKVIMGVTCMVVHDTLSYKGKLVEDTYDWFAQDKNGDVWYFGEDTKEIADNGKVNTEGSWTAGVDGGLPGVIMRGNPIPGDPYRQEYLKGHAEDTGQIIAVNQSITVTAGSYTGCVETKEWSDLEAGTENKWYCSGLGVVKESVAGKEENQLVSVTKP